MAQEFSGYSQSAGTETRRVGMDSDVVDIHDIEPVHFPAILEQAYQDISTSPWKRAEMAFDMRRAADVKAVINVADDEGRIEQVCKDFIHGLEEKLPTGQIDLPATLGPTERATVVARALIEEVSIAEEDINVDQLLITNAQLEYELDKYRKVRTTELAVQEIDARDDEIAALRAEVEQLRARQPGEILRSGIDKVRLFGRGVARMTVARP